MQIANSDIWVGRRLSCRLLESFVFLQPCFVGPLPAKHFSDPRKPFCASVQTSGNTGWLSIPATKTAGSAGT
jgi:hypothetical protein